MNSCADWREQLEDHALGQPAPAALAAHLDDCAACAAALEAFRTRAAELVAGVRQLVVAEPRAELAAHVLASARAEPVSLAARLRWVPALASLALVVGLAAAYGVRGLLEKREEQVLVPSAAALSAWRSPTRSLLRSPADPLLRGVPRLGESLFEIEPPRGESTSPKGARNES